MMETNQVVCENLVHKISQVSTTPLKNIEPNQPLLMCGLDSLIVVELPNWIVSELGSTISPMIYQSIEALAQIGALQSSLVDQASFHKSESDRIGHCLLPINMQAHAGNAGLVG